jgi:hypothetical protein
VWCQNTASQIQSEDNRAAIAGAQGSIEENGIGQQASIQDLIAAKQQQLKQQMF